MKKFIFLFLVFTNLIAYSQNQALNQLVYEIRNPETNFAHFRKALETIGEYLAIDVMNELERKETTVRTLTGGEAKHLLLAEDPVLVTILRAGLPLFLGVQRIFPNSESGFLGMSRNEETLKAKTDYIALPKMENRIVILADTMLATGGTLLDAIKIIEQYQPKQIFVISAVATECGINHILEHNPHIKIFAAVVDPCLNEKGYIVPGLGDAGDRSYGKKHFLFKK